MNRKKLILDVDTGIDDALAIAYALGAQEAELIGVTCCFGNVRVEQAVQNTLAILHLLGRDDIPVFPGKNQRFGDGMPFEPAPACRRIHGENGIGNISLNQPSRAAGRMDAARFMAESAGRFGSGLTIVATAAMTNLARFLRDYKAEAKLVGQIAVMGGALTVPGNVSRFSEANVFSDPEAADYVFRSGHSILMVGLDVTLLTSRRVRVIEDRIRCWRETGTEAEARFYDMLHYYCSNERRAGEEKEGSVHDPLAVAAAFHPEWIKTAGFNLKVETDGESRGRTIGDLSRLKNKEKSIRVCLDAETDAFMEHFISMCRLAMERSVGSKDTHWES